VAKETREIELKVVATGDSELKALTRELEKVQAEAAKTNEQLGSIGKTLAGWGNALKTAGVLAAVGAVTAAFVGLGEAARRAMDDAANISNVSQKLGISAENLSKLRYAGEQADVPFEAIQKSAGILAKNMADLTGKISPATNALRQLGITAKTDMVDALGKIADELNKMPDGAEKTARAMQFFGKAGAELIPMLNDGATGLAAMAAEAEKLGLVWDQKAADQLENFGDNVSYIKKALEGFVIQLTEAATPALFALSEVIKDSIPGADAYKSSLSGVSDAIIVVSKNTVYAVANIRALLAVMDGFRQAFADMSTAIKAGLSAPLAAEGALAGGKGIAAARAAFTAQANQAAAAFDHAKHSIQDGAKAGAQIRADAEKTAAAIDAAYAKAKAGGGTTARPGGTLTNPDAKGDAAKAKADREAAAAALREQKQIEAELQAQREKGLQESEAYTKEMTAYADKINKAGSPWIQMREDIAKLNDAMATGMITAKGYDAEMKRINDTFQKNIGLTDSLTEQFKLIQKAIEDVSKDQIEMAADIKAGWEDIGKTLGQSISGLIAGTEKLRDVFQKTVQMMLQQLIKMAALKIFSSLTGDQQGGFLGSILKSLSGKAKGAAYQGGVELYGSGGVVGAPTAFGTATGIGVMGEAGPEAIMPLQRDSAGNLGVSAPPMNVEVHNYGGSTVDVRRTASDRLEIIVQAADYVARQIRQGGTGVARSIESSYGLGRGPGAFA
jgi:DNA-binding Xre family transcriptional regulator